MNDSLFPLFDRFFFPSRHKNVWCVQTKKYDTAACLAYLCPIDMPFKKYTLPLSHLCGGLLGVPWNLNWALLDILANVSKLQETLSIREVTPYLHYRCIFGERDVNSLNFVRGVFFQYLRGDFPKLHGFSFSYFHLFFFCSFFEGFGKEFGSVLERVEICQQTIPCNLCYD